MMTIDVPEPVILDNLYVNVVLGRDLFDHILKHYGKAGWNAYVRKLRQHNTWAMYSTPEPTEDDEHCMPVCLQIDWKGLSFRGRDLSGLDLTVPITEGCNFDRAKLASSTMGDVWRASFRGADLRQARFEGDITACDFSDADITGASFGEALYNQNEPPQSLPQVTLANCNTYPSDWKPDEARTDDEPRHRLAATSIELRSFWGPLK